MYNPHVVPQMARACVGLVTERAGVRFFSAVGDHVVVELLLLVEDFATHGAGVLLRDL